MQCRLKHHAVQTASDMHKPEQKGNPVFDTGKPEFSLDGR